MTTYDTLKDFAKDFAQSGEYSNYLIIPALEDSKISFHPLRGLTQRVYIEEDDIMLYLYKDSKKLMLDTILNIGTLMTWEIDDPMIMSFIDFYLVDCIESCIYALYYLKKDENYKDLLEKYQDTLLNMTIHLIKNLPDHKKNMQKYIPKINNMDPSINSTEIYQALKENNLI